MIKPNQLSGQQFFEARKSIGLSISSVAKLTNINRNSYSNFEQEKATLTASEKKKLMSFYEDRGYDFEEPETPEINEMVDDYEEAKSDVQAVVDKGDLSGLGQAINALVDSVDDLLVANEYLSTKQETHDSLAISLGDSLTAKAYQETNELLIKLFKSDKSGETEGKTGFFKEDRDERRNRLASILALQQLRVLSITEPELITLSRNEVEAYGIDNKRLLDGLAEALDYGVLGEISEVTSKDVA
jgi:transcriptional regulator with XRE-family HTH domain